MPIRLADVAREQRATTLDTAFGPVELVYRPNALTFADQARLMGLKGDAMLRELLIQMRRLLVSWDLVGPVVDAETGATVVEMDAPVPVEPEVMQFIPHTILTAVYKGIFAELNPKEEGEATTTTTPKTSPKLFAGSFG